MSNILSGIIALGIIGGVFAYIQFRLRLLREAQTEKERQTAFLHEARIRLIRVIESLREE
jgi:mannose/fructose/N-acetylgalactosamine-specific phosphotransferase system component IIC